MPSLACSVTLLTNFSTPSKEPLAWELGTHGIRISFTYHSRRCGATYLPDVAPEQGWTKEEAIVSLMRKAGWSGNSSSWQRVWRDGKGELVTYEGKKVELKHAEWKEWREWVEDQGIESSGKS
jgi:AMMECR1 domain-containing protein